jgi:choice-of-anchor B domain-containing protein
MRSLSPLAALATVCTLICAPPPAAAAPTAYNTTLVGSLAMTPNGSTTDLWVQGNYVYLGRGTRGMSVIDVSNPALPQKVSDWTAPGVEIGDVTANGNRCYLSSQGSSGVGVYIVDVSNPANPQTIGTISSFNTSSVHTLYIDGLTLYCSSNITGDLRIWDVTNASAPRELGHTSPGGWHESTVMNNICYDAAGTANLHIYNVSNPSNPVQIGQKVYNKTDSTFYTHSAWPSADFLHLYTTDEYTEVNGRWKNGGLRVWDISQISTPLQKAVWKSDLGLTNSNVTIHKPKVYGATLDVSYYQDGVRVLDITNPEIPIEVGFYDTYPEPVRTLFEGCWGVMSANGLIYASDITHGLFIISYNGTRGGSVSGTITDASTGLPIKQATVYYVQPNRRTRSNAAGTYGMRTGAGTHTVQVSAAGYNTLSTTATVVAGTVTTANYALTHTTGPAPSAAGTPSESPVVSLIPHPFRGHGVVNLALSEGAVVTVRLYDLAGREVAMLADGWFEAGAMGIAWDGTDARRRQLARGVYLWRGTVAGRTYEGKVIVAP